MGLDISCKSSVKQMIHLKYKDLLSLKNNEKKIDSSLLQILLDALRVNALWLSHF